MLRILVVEDEPLLASSLVEVLSDEGYAVELARDGFEAEVAMASGPRDLVFLDCGLPTGPDGFELLARWRSAGRRENIILMSGNQHHAEKAQGAQAFLAKPFSFSDLLTLVAHWAKPSPR